MKPATTKAANPDKHRREQQLLDRKQAPPLRDLFPQLGHVSLMLTFSDATRPVPSAQSHTFYPAARAHFRFPCPCFDCDGEFDLSGEVKKLALAGKAVGRANGAMQCEGADTREAAQGSRCSISLTYKIETAAVDGSRTERK